MSPLLSIAADGIQRLSPSARRERALVVHVPVARADLLDAVPARARTVAADVDRVARDERLPAAEVAVLRTPHPAVGERLELDGRPRLRDARAEVAEILVVRGRLDVGVVRDRHRRRPAPVDRGVRDLDLILREARPVLVDRDERSGSARRGRRVAVGVGRKRRREVRVDRLHVLVHEARGLAVQHRVALERPDADTRVAGAEQELVRGHRERVLAGPDADLRVVVELRLAHRRTRTRTSCPSDRSTSRPRCTPSTEACWSSRERELRDHPALGELVVDHDRVAAVQRPAVRRPREQRVDRRRRHDLCAGLRPGGELRVDDLDVVVLADGSVRVRRVAAARVAHAFEVLVRRRRPRAVRPRSGARRHPSGGWRAGRGTSGSRSRSRSP